MPPPQLIDKGLRSLFKKSSAKALNNLTNNIVVIGIIMVMFV